MNKQELIGHVADRSGLSRNDAMRAVETMLEVITSTLKRGDEVRLVGLRQFLGHSPQGVDRPQSAHRRADADQGQFAAEIPSWQSPQGRRSIAGQQSRLASGVGLALYPPLLPRSRRGRVAQW